MVVSDVISSIALVVSIFSFYWVAYREVRKLYLVRADSPSLGSDVKFILLNAGNKNVLISGIIVAFEGCNDGEWTAPDLDALKGIRTAFVLKSGESEVFEYCITKQARDGLIKEGSPKINEKNDSLDFIVTIMVEWFDASAKEHRAEAKIANIGFLNRGGKLSNPLVKTHQLYKSSS